MTDPRTAQSFRNHGVTPNVGDAVMQIGFFRLTQASICAYDPATIQSRAPDTKMQIKLLRQRSCSVGVLHGDTRMLGDLTLQVNLSPIQSNPMQHGNTLVQKIALPLYL